MIQTTTSNDPEHHFFGSNIQAAYGLLSPKQISMALSLSFVKQKARMREWTAETQDMLYLPSKKR